MIKKLVQHGNSAAIIIDKSILELLKIQMDTPLELSTDGRKLIITPQLAASRSQRMQNSLEKVRRNHGRTLKKLAE